MNIIITGASRGIGLETALLLAQDPENRVLALSRNEVGLKKLDSATKENLSYLIYDLTQAPVAALQEKIKWLGGVDILINNAGLLVNKPFASLTKADWQQSFEVNLFGVVELIQLVLPFLEKSENAHILNIGSMGGFQGSSKFPGLSAYSAAKGALACLTECLAEELKGQKIAVNCLALGAVQTEMLAEAFPGYQAPLSSAEMAKFMVYFSTEGHRFFNGKILPVAVSTP